MDELRQKKLTKEIDEIATRRARKWLKELEGTDPGLDIVSNADEIEVAPVNNDEFGELALEEDDEAEGPEEDF